MSGSKSKKYRQPSKQNVVDPATDPEPNLLSTADEPTAAAARSWLARMDRYVFILLSIPALVLARNTNPIFTPVGYLDPWIYFSFFNNLIEFKRRLFPHTYYGSRLAWILPGALVYNVFAPVVANCVLHLTVFYAAVLSLYYILKSTIGRRGALLAAVLFAFHPYLWQAAGGDYVDGAGVAYYLLATAATVRAAGRSDSRFSLLLGACAFAGAVYTNIFWVAFFPPLLVLYVGLGSRDRWISSATWCVAWFALGGVLITAILAVANFSLDGSLNFYRPSIEFVLGLVGKRNPWKAPNYSWVRHARWLYADFIALVVSVVYLAVYRWKESAGPARARGLFALNYLMLLAMMVYVEWNGGNQLQLDYYASYLMPAAFLTIGSHLHWPENVSSRVFWGGVALLGLFLAAPWWGIATNVTETLRNANEAILLAPLSIVISLSVVRPGKASVVAALAGFAVLAFSLADAWYTSPANRLAHSFRRITEGMKFVEATRAGSKVLFWFDADDVFGQEFHSLNSTYLWGYSQLNFHFPSLAADAALGNDTVIVVPSSRSESGEIALRTLRAAGKNASIIAQIPIESGGGRYFLFFLKMRRDLGEVKPRRTEFDPTNLCRSLSEEPDMPDSAGAGRATLYRLRGGVTVARGTRCTALVE